MIIPIMGGLGNQLFQYAAGIHVRKFSSKVTRFSLNGLLIARNTPRSYMLGDLLNDDEISRRGRLYFALIRILSLLYPSIWISEKDSSDLVLARITKSSRVLLGYFQRLIYLDAVFQEVLSALSNSTLFSPIFTHSQRNNIAVHIRFGDYLTDATTRKVHGLSAISYYVDAVKRLESTHHYDNIVIFSDDRGRAIAEFTAEYGVGGLPICQSTGTTEYEDLGEISSCKGIVVSNSTFSWWAAWIGSQLHECNVVAPRPWFAIPTAADENLIPDEWTVLDRELQP